MKKWLFFKSSSSTDSSRPSSLSDKKGDHSSRNLKGLLPRSRKSGNYREVLDVGPNLRRSLSFSSANFNDIGALKGRKASCSSAQSLSPSSSNISNTPHNLPRWQSVTPERHPKGYSIEGEGNIYYNRQQRTHTDDKFSRVDGGGYSTRNTSTCSSNTQSAVLDLYIDGEQNQERNRRARSVKENGGLPPRNHCVPPLSPALSDREKKSTSSFTERTASGFLPNRDLVDGSFSHECPKKLARHVMEKLSQPRTQSGGSRRYHGTTSPKNDSSTQTYCPLGEENLKNQIFQNPREMSHRFTYSHISEGSSSPDGLRNMDFKIQIKYCKARERAFLLSREHEHEQFLQNSGFNVPTALIQRIRDLSEERVSLAFEVLEALHHQIEEHIVLNTKVEAAKAELVFRTQNMEKENNEVKEELEEEFERRSSQWSFQLDKYRIEEQRLRDRARELAEQNVSLQREVSSSNEKEEESRNIINRLESQLKKVENDNMELVQNFSVLKEKYAEVNNECGRLGRGYEEKEKECMELNKSVSRLLRSCSDQDKTISGLRDGVRESIGRKQSFKVSDNNIISHLKMEQIRLTGVEQQLRKEVESYRLDVDSLQKENANFSNILKIGGGHSLTHKLDQEMLGRVKCLQNKGIFCLNESFQLCSKLFDFIKNKANFALDIKENNGIFKNGVLRNLEIESETKLQGLKRAAENLAMNLQTVSLLIHEKSNIGVLESRSELPKNGFGNGSIDPSSMECLRAELKAETLLTNLLRDKLHSRDLEVEQLQSELASSVRGNDILRHEIQNSMDYTSHINDKMNDLELQVEKMKSMKEKAEEKEKEVEEMKGRMKKVAEERDVMWGEVKNYREKEKVLNSQLCILRNKVDALEEDVLLKEGQISILQDSHHVDLDSLFD